MIRFLAIWLICILLCGCTADDTESIVITHSPLLTDTETATAETAAAETAERPSETVETAAAVGETVYILNTNTKKFHLPTCSSVKDMKDKNRRDSDAGREKIINEGYVPCKRCNP